jgi:hypothetical protein
LGSLIIRIFLLNTRCSNLASVVVIVLLTSGAPTRQPETSCEVIVVPSDLSDLLACMSIACRCTRRCECTDTSNMRLRPQHIFVCKGGANSRIAVLIDVIQQDALLAQRVVQHVGCAHQTVKPRNVALRVRRHARKQVPRTRQLGHIAWWNGTKQAAQTALRHMARLAIGVPLAT